MIRKIFPSSLLTASKYRKILYDRKKTSDFEISWRNWWPWGDLFCTKCIMQICHDWTLLQLLCWNFCFRQVTIINCSIIASADVTILMKDHRTGSIIQHVSLIFSSEIGLWTFRCLCQVAITYPAFSDATIDMWDSFESCKGERPGRGTSGAMFCSVFAVMPATWNGNKMFD